jgi:hypothetical protein
MRPPSRCPIFTSLAVALVAVSLAVGVTIGAWWWPASNNKSSATPTYTDQQIADAKAKVCVAFDKVRQAVSMNTNRSPGDDPTSVLTVATSARQTLDFGNTYLLSKLAEEPATPPDLADAVRGLANSYRELTLGYLDGLDYSDASLKPTMNTIEEQTPKIESLCK